MCQQPVLTRALRSNRIVHCFRGHGLWLVSALHGAVRRQRLRTVAGGGPDVLVDSTSQSMRDIRRVRHAFHLGRPARRESRTHDWLTRRVEHSLALYGNVGKSGLAHCDNQETSLMLAVVDPE